MLWLCLRLPRLPLEVRSRAMRRGGPPLAVADPQRGRVVAADGRARACGVRPGMGLAAARALCAGLRVLPRDPDAEAEALARLAAWAGRFSDRVGLAPPCSVLVEVGGSLRLFGGAERLRLKVAAGLEALGYTFGLAAAPTPLAARWLAQARPGSWVPDAAALEASLDALPLDLPLEAVPAQALARLRAWGLRRLGELARLPRAGLARRVGPELTAALDRARGLAPDPVAPFAPPAAYRGRLELPAPCADAGALAFALRRLLAELEGWLAGRDGAVSRLTLTLGHAGGAATPVALPLAAPCADAARLLELLRLRLERTRLPAPVLSLTLESGPAEPAAPRTGELLGAGAEGPREPPAALLDRLDARLGRGALAGIAPADDHRPERAWRRVAPAPAGDGGRDGRGRAPSSAEPPPPGQRPLWLLPRPRPLPARRGMACLPAGLRLVAGPERIDTGWWDGRPVARDYYVAETPEGARWWVFRERRGTRGWYLHGLFA